MSQTLWIHQVFVLGEASAMPGAIAALDIAFPCDDGSPRDPAHPEKYGSKYSANGQLPATHYGCAFVVTEEIRQTFESMGLDKTPGIAYWRASNPGDILAASNQPASLAHVGEAWTWQDCLTAMGLQPVSEPIH